ncbi:hypothetical protein CEXT_261021 [Caerostris extrusa]|uniref:Uncharacterized protein n=1 Tax=Caerostris extrusa TaxID=172846 RepID=A0AAV4Y0I0_CAEEX|nr:hypothetical protein CEXT_261021 [Caerostris extrusa]
MRTTRSESNAETIFPTTKFIIAVRVRLETGRSRRGKREKFKSRWGSPTCQQVANINFKPRCGFPLFPKSNIPPPNRILGNVKLFWTPSIIKSFPKHRLIYPSTTEARSKPCQTYYQQYLLLKRASLKKNPPQNKSLKTAKKNFQNENNAEESTAETIFPTTKLIITAVCGLLGTGIQRRGKKGKVSNLDGEVRPVSKWRSLIQIEVRFSLFSKK